MKKHMFLSLILSICINCVVYGACKKVANQKLRQRAIASESQKKTLDHCVYKDIYGCVFKKEYLCNENSDTLVIYLRGHWKYRGKVPWYQSIRDRSMEQAIGYYELDKVYDNQQDPILVSSSSNVGFTITEIQNALEKAELPPNSNIIIAAHSGAFHGLRKTLDYLKQQPSTNYSFKLKKIIMLDNFYFSSSLSRAVKEEIEKGAECNGYYTKHNKQRYYDRFEKLVSQDFCKVQYKKYHNQTVNLCLESYLKDDSCDIDT